jgi:hypothetical protein
METRDAQDAEEHKVEQKKAILLVMEEDGIVVLLWDRIVEGDFADDTVTARDYDENVDIKTLWKLIVRIWLFLKIIPTHDVK